MTDSRDLPKRIRRWLSQLSAAIRRRLAERAFRQQRGAPDPVTAARARFWASVEEGRREAEARSSKGEAP